MRISVRSLCSGMCRMQVQELHESVILYRWAVCVPPAACPAVYEPELRRASGKIASNSSLARGTLDEDLSAADAGHNLIAEVGSCLAQRLDSGDQVIDLK